MCGRPTRHSSPPTKMTVAGRLRLTKAWHHREFRGKPTSGALGRQAMAKRHRRGQHERNWQVLASIQSSHRRVSLPWDRILARLVYDASKVNEREGQWQRLRCGRRRPWTFLPGGGPPNSSTLTSRCLAAPCHQAHLCYCSRRPFKLPSAA